MKDHGESEPGRGNPKQKLREKESGLEESVGTDLKTKVLDRHLKSLVLFQTTFGCNFLERVLVYCRVKGSVIKSKGRVMPVNKGLCEEQDCQLLKNSCTNALKG